MSALPPSTTNNTNKPTSTGALSSTSNTTAINNADDEYNPRWKGYLMIAVTSLITFAAVSNIAVSTRFQGHPGVALAFGVVTFALAIVILLLDRFQLFLDKFNYMKAYDGKLEGCMLTFLVLFWIFGVAFITQVDGVGYLTLNVYFGSWLTLVSCVYTLDQWSASKDILSIEELTSVSATLKSWYVVFFSSLVVLGTSINFQVYWTVSLGGAAMGIAMGTVSSIISFIWISIHYNFITVVTQGGWIELGCACLLALVWIATTAVITQDGGVGATINGNVCPSAYLLQAEQLLQTVENCSIALLGTNVSEYVAPCNAFLNIEVSGSNLYVFTWLALGATLNLLFRWKAQQALQFAQAQKERRQEDEEAEEDDDLDEFEDAEF